MRGLARPASSTSRETVTDGVTLLRSVSHDRVSSRHSAEGETGWKSGGTDEDLHELRVVLSSMAASCWQVRN